MDRITGFVESFVPKNLPKKRADELREELTCHILDKADYYREIGYDKNDSIDKAIAAFGTDESSKNYILKEFEELYSERSIFGIIAFFIIAAMNALCVPLDIWVYSADFNRDPDPLGAFISFSMTFVVLLMITVARIKKYRKTLISIAVANTLIAGSLLCSFYPQMAAYTIGDNIIYLIDRFTPISVGNAITMHIDSLFTEGMIALVLQWAFLLVPAIYCIIEAVRIGKGKANPVKNPKNKVLVFCALFLASTAVSCLLQPASQRYVDDYPVWLDNYDNCISEESSQKFDEISIGDTYSEVSNFLSSEGYISIEQYRNSLDKLTKKQFDNNLKEFTFKDGFEVWFDPDPDKWIKGNGFVGIKKENDIITAVGIGNLNQDMYSGKYYNFGYWDDYDHDIYGMIGNFRALNEGNSETEVMSKLTGDYGVIYTKIVSLEDGKKESYYRVYCHGEIDPEAKAYRDMFDERYVELFFENGKLTYGEMYDEIYLDKGSKVESESIRMKS